VGTSHVSVCGRKYIASVHAICDASPVLVMTFKGQCEIIYIHDPAGMCSGDCT
jgi:hypothetical protein